MYEYQKVAVIITLFFFKKKTCVIWVLLISIKDKNYHGASTKYISALRDVIPVLEENRDVEMLKISLYSNLAACQLNLKQYERVILNCNKALIINDSHQKCIYRRACAYLEMQNLDEARSDVERLLMLDSSNAAAKLLKDRLQKLCTRKDAKDAQFMRKFLNT